MVWLAVALLVALWLAGLAWDILGGLIHLLLALAAVVAIANLVRGRGQREPDPERRGE